MEDALGGEVLIGRSGGASPSGTFLTKRGRDAIRRYRCVTAGLEDLIATRFAEAFLDDVGDDACRPG
ncbi:MAG: hypothetical protein J2P17_14020 [Mycobacterium sp.]|nr:hypothetical protein [Mycobacterium sp.]